MKTKELFFYILAGMIILCFFGLLYVLVFKPIPDINEEMLYLIVGALVGSFTSVVSFFFGSSSGSKDKTNYLFNGKLKTQDLPPDDKEEK